MALWNLMGGAGMAAKAFGQNPELVSRIQERMGGLDQAQQDKFYSTKFGGSFAPDDWKEGYEGRRMDSWADKIAGKYGWKPGGESGNVAADQKKQDGMGWLGKMYGQRLSEGRNPGGFAGMLGKMSFQGNTDIDKWFSGGANGLPGGAPSTMGQLHKMGAAAGEAARSVASGKAGIRRERSQNRARIAAPAMPQRSSGMPGGYPGTPGIAGPVGMGQPRRQLFGDMRR